VITRRGAGQSPAPDAEKRAGAQSPGANADQTRYSSELNALERLHPHIGLPEKVLQARGFAVLWLSQLLDGGKAGAISRPRRQVHPPRPRRSSLPAAWRSPL